MGVVKVFFLSGLVLVLTGCPQFPVDPILPPAPVSNVIENNNGNRFVVHTKAGNLVVSLWNISIHKWEAKHLISNVGSWSKIYPSLNNINPQAIYLYSAFPPKYLSKALLTSPSVQASVRQIPNNYSIISGDEFVVYNGLNVQLHQLGTDVISNLHVLPPISAISGSLGLNIDATQFQMLCTPENAYQWDYKTHFCIVANIVGYPDSNITTLPNINNFYEVNIIVNADGSYSYTLLNQGSYDAHGGAYPILEEHYSPKPSAGIYSSVIQLAPTTERADTFSIDSQGNLHLFYVLKDDPNVYYEYYTQNNPTTPLYTQVLP